MATVSLSPTPATLSAMSTRRVPLSSNPNVANSPLRGGSSIPIPFSKQKRSFASTQREELYGQPPPVKKQLLNNASVRAIRSPTKSQQHQHEQRNTQQRAASQTGSLRGYTADKERAGCQRTAAKAVSSQTQDQSQTQEDADAVVRKWAERQRSQFPGFVFYFESVPDEMRAKLARQVVYLGAREEKFFSINITHVVTTRPVPQPASRNASQANPAVQETHEQPQTINPSLLSRTSDTGSAKRNLFDTVAAGRRPAIQFGEDQIVRRPKVARSVDVLERALAYDKKVWSLEKFQRVVSTIIDPDRSASAGGSARTGSHRQASKSLEDGNLRQLLNRERVNGPSDRDPTVAKKEMHLFKGPYLYIYDIEEKQRPMMIREYNKVAEKHQGDWPQFRSAANGRCPFVEDDMTDKSSKKKQQQTTAAAAETVAKMATAPANPAVESAPKLQPSVQISRPKPVTGKRTLAEREEAANRGAAPQAQGLAPTEIFAPSKIISPPTINFNPTANAFTSTSRARPARFLAGEPVASGLQPSGVTSAIRSQMISSTTGTLGAGKTGVSKEVMGLQRKVLQKNDPTSQQDLSSRRHPAEMSIDSGSFTRSASLGNSRRKLEAIDEATLSAREERHKRTNSVPSRMPPKPSRKRDPKPGYCENCQDKFDDFDDHIQSRTHRKFAENCENWAELDALLAGLNRLPRDFGDDGVCRYDHFDSL